MPFLSTRTRAAAWLLTASALLASTDSQAVIMHISTRLVDSTGLVAADPSNPFHPLAGATLDAQIEIDRKPIPAPIVVNTATESYTAYRFDSRDVRTSVTVGGSPLTFGGLSPLAPSPDPNSSGEVTDATMFYDYTSIAVTTPADRLSIRSTELVEPAFTGFPHTSLFAELHIEGFLPQNTLDDTIQELPTQIPATDPKNGLYLNLTMDTFLCADASNPACIKRYGASFFAMPFTVGFLPGPSPTTVPEPGPMALLLTGLLGLRARRRRNPARA